jgi:hypothetical protein
MNIHSLTFPKYTQSEKNISKRLKTHKNISFARNKKKWQPFKKQHHKSDGIS